MTELLSGREVGICELRDFVGWGLGYSYHCNPLKT